MKLESMPRHELETFYKATHNACRYVLRLPSPRLIQELVQAWRALRRRVRDVEVEVKPRGVPPSSPQSDH